MPRATIWQTQGQQSSLNTVVSFVRSPTTWVLFIAKSISYNVYLINSCLLQTSLSYVHFVLYLQPPPLYIWTDFSVSCLRKYPLWIPYPLLGLSLPLHSQHPVPCNLRTYWEKLFFREKKFIPYVVSKHTILLYRHINRVIILCFTSKKLYICVCVFIHTYTYMFKIFQAESTFILLCL